jgi:hypothetical protein
MHGVEVVAVDPDVATQPRLAVTTRGRKALTTGYIPLPEVSGHLVGPSAFKAVGRGDPTTAGSIPVHLRQVSTWGVWYGGSG